MHHQPTVKSHVKQILLTLKARTMLTKIPYINPDGTIDMDALDRAARLMAIHGKGYGDATFEQKLAWEREHFMTKALEYQAVARNRLARGEKLAPADERPTTDYLP